MSNIILDGIFSNPQINNNGRIYDKKVFDIEYQKLLKSLLLKDRIQKINKLKDKINEHKIQSLG